MIIGKKTPCISQHLRTSEIIRCVRSKRFCSVSLHSKRGLFAGVTNSSTHRRRNSKNSRTTTWKWNLCILLPQNDGFCRAHRKPGFCSARSGTGSVRLIRPREYGLRSKAPAACDSGRSAPVGLLASLSAGRRETQHATRETRDARRDGARRSDRSAASSSVTTRTKPVPNVYK